MTGPVDDRLPSRLQRAAAAAFEPLASYGYEPVPCRWPDCAAYSNGRWLIEVDHDWKEGELIIRIGEYATTGTADPVRPAMRPIEDLLPPAAVAALRLRRLKPAPSTGMLTSRLRRLVEILRTDTPDLLLGPDPTDR